jgi:hypothetical protein
MNGTSSGELPPDLRATRSYWPAQASDPQQVSSVVVIEEDRSSVHALPATGMLLVGRSPEADIQLAAEAASRKHARLLVSDGLVRIVDLDSHNGTLVNGEPLQAARVLGTGDVITIGAATLVLTSGTATTPTRTLLDGAQLHQRLFEEVTRASRYQRQLTVAAITFGRAPENAEAAAASLGALLRPLDLVGTDGAGQWILLLPEIDDVAVGALVDRVAEESRVSQSHPSSGKLATPSRGAY